MESKTTCVLTITGSTLRSKDIEDDNGYAEILNSTRRQCQPSIIFLKGYPSAKWLTTIGTIFPLDPNWFWSYISFKSLGDFFSLRSESLHPHSIMKLPVLTIGVYQAENQDGDQVPLKELRAAARHDMQRYRENLSTENISNGDSIVRNYFPIDHSYFVIEQDISIAVVQVGNSWTGLCYSLPGW